MNKPILIAATCLLGTPAVAQDPPATLLVAPQQRQEKTPEQLVEQRAEKLAKPVFHEADWIINDYDKAKAVAKKEGKWILTYFTRSYSP